MLAGGTEASICPVGVAGFTALTALSTVDDPEKCSLPFDKNRSGFVMGEGSGVVVLEELEHAKQRGAKILAEVVGIILLRRQRMVPGLRKRWNWHWKKRE